MNWTLALAKKLLSFDVNKAIDNLFAYKWMWVWVCGTFILHANGKLVQKININLHSQVPCYFSRNSSSFRRKTWLSGEYVHIWEKKNSCGNNRKYYNRAYQCTGTMFWWFLALSENGWSLGSNHFWEIATTLYVIRCYYCCCQIKSKVNIIGGRNKKCFTMGLYQLGEQNPMEFVYCSVPR